MIKILIICLLLHALDCFYEIELFRNPQKSKYNNKKWEINNCTNSEDEEPCYYKDIAYTLHLYYEHSIYSLSADLTAPISWIKGKNCKTLQTNPSKCHLIKQSIIGQIKESLFEFQQSISALRRHQMKIAETEHNQTQTGGIQKVKGVFQKNKQLSFWTVDSNRYVSIMKIFGVGFFIDGQKDEIKLSHTNYINSTLVDPLLNSVCDGAVSLRFDVDSQNSFLNEIFEAIDENQRTVTLFIDHKNTMTLGQVSTKNVAGGEEGIQWIQLDNKNYLTTKSIGIGDQKQQKQLQKGIFKTYLTLSASYLSFPKQIFDKLIQKLSQNKCKKIQNNFLQCSHITKQFKNINIILTIQNIQILYPLQNLILQKKSSSLILNIRQSDSDVVILGQPHFKNYFSVFDYKKNMIGLGHKFIINEQTAVTTIIIIRFMVFCLVFGCSLILLSKPIKIGIKKLKVKLNDPNIKDDDLVVLRPDKMKKLPYGRLQQQNDQL